MAIIKCPECGREISTMAPACPGCGILKEDIQKLLGPDSGNQKPLTRKSRKMLACVACHVENEEGVSSVCAACGYPLLSLSSDKKQVKKAVESYKRRETKKTPEKPVQVTDTPKKPEPGPEKPTPTKIEPQPGTAKPVPPKPTPQTPPSDKKSGKTKVKVAALAGVAGVVVFIGLFFRKKTEPQPVPSTERTVSAVSESTESASVVTTSSYSQEPVISESVSSSSEIEPPDVHKLSGNYNIGDTLTFGSYEQDNNPNNGTEEIEWLVLDKDEEGYLLVSKYGLDAKPYNEENVDVTWETCTLRTWLNEDFYNTAFESDERQQIRTTHVVAEKNPEYDTNPGNNTDDPVFLLSIQEAKKYFASDEERKAYPTEYAKANGAYENSSTKCCWWWLRSPGGHSTNAAYVRNAGWVFRDGSLVPSDFGCVRPALWVNL